MIEIKNGCAIHSVTRETVPLEHIAAVYAAGGGVKILCGNGMCHRWATLRDASTAESTDEAFEAEYQRAKKEAQAEVDRLSRALQLLRVHAYKTLTIGGAQASTRLWSSLVGVDLAGDKVTLLWSEGGRGVIEYDTADKAEAARAEICDRWAEWRAGVSVD